MTPLERFQAAGFTDEEIGQWAAQKREAWRAAGFDDDEIDHYLQGPKEPVPAAFIERMRRGTALGRVIGRTGEGLAAGWGEPEDMAPETVKFWRDIGIFNDPAKGQASPLRFAYEAALRPLSAGFNVMGSAFGAGVTGAGALAGGIAEELGADAGSAGRLARDVRMLGEMAAIAPTFRGHVARPELSPTGAMREAPIGGLPEASDFAAASRVVTGRPAPIPSVTEKLRRLWRDHGVHPAEVATDAARDPTIAQDLVSATGELPSAYVGPNQPRPMPPRRPTEAAGALEDTPATGVSGQLETGLPTARMPPQIRSFAPGELRVDPQRFQFKAGADTAGVTNRLHGVETWDPIKAGLGIVFEDRDGAMWIADGHQRLGLATRIEAADPAQRPRLNAWVLREADGVSAADARAFAAAKNIAEGTGSAVDAAKVLRDRPDLLPGLPPRSELVRQSQALVNLSDEAFGMVVNGVVPDNQAAIVGRLAPQDPKLQTALIDLLARLKPDNATQAEAIVRQGIDAGTRVETQAELFGDRDIVSSLYLERARVLDRALRDLRRDRVVFNALVDNRAVIEELGNRLAADENAARAVIDGRAAQILQTLANRKGALSDALTAAARDLADGRAGLAAVSRDFVAAIRRQAESGDLARAADGGGGRVVAAAGESGARPAEPVIPAEEHPRHVTSAEEAVAADRIDAAIRPAPAPRSPWPADFPQITVGQSGAPRGQRLTDHPDFRAAKTGNAEAAERVANDLMTPEMVEAVRTMIGDRRPIVVPVHIERGNALPFAVAARLREAFDLPIGEGIVQAGHVGRRGMSGPQRVTTRAGFEGPVTAGADYLLVDDFVTQGGTLADLRGYIEGQGGHVVGAVALAGQRRSLRLAPSAEVIERLRARFGALEAEWQERYGYGFDALTNSEAEFVARARDERSFRDDFLAGRQSADDTGSGGSIGAATPEGEGPAAGGLSEPAEPFFQPRPGTPPVGLSLGAPPPRRTPAEQAILDRISVGEREDRRPFSWDRLYTAVWDRLNPIPDRAPGGERLPTPENPYRMMRLLAGNAGRARHWLEFGQVDFGTGAKIGPSLQEILAPVRRDLDGYRAFETAVRALELESAGITTGVNLGAARAVVAAGVDRYAPLMDRMIEYDNNLAAYLRDSGVLSRAGYEEMLKANKLYVPFHRVIGDAPGENFGVGSLQPRNPLRRIKGSERAIIDTIESRIRRTYLFIEMAERNQAGTVLADMMLAAEPPRPAPGRTTTTATPAVRLPEPRGTGWSREFQQAVSDDLFPERGPIPEERLIREVPDAIAPDVAQAIRELLRNRGLNDELFDFMASAAPVGEGEIRVFRDGRPVRYQVGRDIADAVKNLDASAAGWLARWLASDNPVQRIPAQIAAVPARILRAGATLTAEFMLRNIFVDYLTAVVQSEKPFFTPWDVAKALYSVATRDRYFAAWLKNGGGNAELVAMDRRYLQDSLRKLTAETGVMDRAWNVVTHPLDALRMLSEVSEQATRLGEFRYVYEREIAAGRSTKEAGQTAAYASRNVTIDFARHGSVMQSLNMISAFFNAQLQGASRVVQAIRDNPGKTALAIAGGITLPSILLWTANHDDPRYREAPDWERDFFWFIMTDHWRDGGPAVGPGAPVPPDSAPFAFGGTSARIRAGRFEVNDGWVFKLRKPFELGILFGSGIERLLDLAFTDKPEALKGFTQNLLGAVLPNPTPTVGVPILEQAMNRGMFTDRNLIPEYLKRELPEYQYHPYTTETAKALGQLIGAFPGMRDLATSDSAASGVARALTTPLLIENYVRAWTGGLGMYTLQLTDAALRKQGLLPDPEKPPWDLSDIPVIKAFVMRYPKAGAQSIQDFYDVSGRVARYATSWSNRAAEGDLGAAQRVQEAGGPTMWVEIDGMRRAIAEQARTIRNIDKNPEIPGAEKRQLIDSLHHAQIIIAQHGLQRLRAAEKALRAPEGR